MALEDDVRTFAQIPMFRLLEPEALRLLAFSAETKLLRAGDYLLRFPASLEGGYLVVKGSLAIFDDAEALGAPRQLVNAPALVGELAMIAQTQPLGSIMAREPTTLLKISRHVFHRILAEYPRSAQALHAILKERVISLTEQLSKLASH